jgi:ABC-type multidrug transport system permease subunit
MNRDFSFPEPSPELYQKIIKRLKREQRKAAVLKALLFLFISMLAGACIVFVAYQLIAALNQSGFAQIILLIFSDYQTIAAYWQNYTLAILESAPLLPIIYLLISCLVFLLALKKGLLNLQKLTLKY